MIDGGAFLIFLGGALLLNLTPGPDVAFTLASSIRSGVRSGIAAALGIGVGSLCWAAATAAGLAALLAASQHALTIIKVLGGLYLLYLAYRTLVEKEALDDPSGASDAVRAFRSGILTNLFNPKVGLFFLAFLPGFTDPASDSVLFQILFLGAVFSFTGTVVLIAVALGAGGFRKRLEQSARARRWLKAISASVFGGLGAYLIVSDQR